MAKEEKYQLELKLNKLRANFINVLGCLDTAIMKAFDREVGRIMARGFAVVLEEDRLVIR